jgi:hypothetical protein
MQRILSPWVAMKSVYVNNGLISREIPPFVHIVTRKFSHAEMRAPRWHPLHQHDTTQAQETGWMQA